MTNDADLKTVLKSVGDLGQLFSSVSKGLSLVEIPEGVAVVNDASALMGSASLIVPEWEQLDDDARADLIQYAQANCKFPASLAVEKYVQLVLKAAIINSALVQGLLQK